MLKTYSRYKIILQVLFWICSVLFAIAAFYVASDYKLVLNSNLVFRAILPNIGFALAVYINLYVLIPRYLKANNYIFYTFWLLILLAAASSIIQISIVFLLQTKSFREQFFSLFSSHYFTAAFYVGITSLFKFVKDWIQLQQINLKLSQIEREKLEAELNTLKSQLNPHFLFNCLNNIYSLALSNSPKTPDIVLKLSEMMRYVLYESRENYIPVKKELDFLGNFIELQKIRLNNKIDISYTIEGKIPDLKVIPLIFEPFIDNAFKHGIHHPADQPFIHIEVKFIDSLMKFSVRNNFRHLNSNKHDGKSSGIGLKNIEKRLNYLYQPEEYNYEVTKSESLFEVRMEVQLK